MRQLQPAAGVVLIKARHIQRAVIEQVEIGLAVFRVVRLAGDKFIDVFKALVVAHIHHHAIVRRQHQHGAFVLDAAQRGALDRGGFGVERVDFHHPAKAVRFVRGDLAVKAEVGLRPFVAGVGGLDAVALVVSAQFAVVGEVIAPVFFTGQVGAPRRLAIGAVVQRAQHAHALGVVLGFHQCVALGRAADGARGGGGDATGQRRRAHHAPALAGVFHFNHRHAHGGLRLGGFLVVPVGHAVRVQQAIIGVFVVDGQQAALAVRRAKRQREVGHAVVVHAGLQRLFFGAVAGVLLEGRLLARHADRIAPGVQHLGGIASRHMHHVIRRERQAGKAQAQRRGRGRVGGLRQLADRAASQAQRQRGAQALEQTTTVERGFKNGGKRRVGRGVDDAVVGFDQAAHG